MIDVESEIYKIVSQAVKFDFPNAFTSGEYVDVPAQFPAVTIVEADNSVYAKMSTTKIENAVHVMYEVNIYSNLASGRRQEVKKILKVVDREFESLGFTRTMSTPIPNLQDAKIFRQFVRYEGVIQYDPDIDPDIEEVRIYTK